MTKVLGIALVHHDSGATLVENGKIIAALHEERITRIKHDGSFPYNSIKGVLSITNTQPEEIDAIAIPWDAKYLESVRKSPRQTYGYFIDKLMIVRELKICINEFGFKNPDIQYVRHPLSHAASAYFTSGMKDALVVSCDGAGEMEALVAYDMKDGYFNELMSVSNDNSIGAFYSSATEALGFKPGDGEGKTMGLSVYGKPVLYDELNKIFPVGGKTFKTDLNLTAYHKIDSSDRKLYCPYRSVRYPASPLFDDYLKNNSPEDVSASIQKHLEVGMVSLIENLLNETGNENICLAGGVFLNVKLNKKLMELEQVKDIYIHPSPNDGGLGTGAALYTNNKIDPKNFKTEKIRHPYFGFGFSDEDIENMLKELNVEYEKVSDIEKQTAELVASGKVVGWFQGRMEYGPRALGNRSVLANPSIPEIRDKINHFLKLREWFMPFAPSALDKYKGDYFIDARESPFMTL